MSNSTGLVVPLIVLMVIGIAAADPTVSADERDRLMQRQRAFFDAVENLNADEAADKFAEDAVMHVAGMPPVEGRESIRRFYGNLFRFLSASTATPEATVVSEGGDMAFSWGSTSNAFSGPQGVVEYTGKFLIVWKIVDGEWLIAAYSISSNQRDSDR